MSFQSEKDEFAARMLAAIHKETKGDTSRTAGMWAIGENMGLDRDRTENLAMSLVGEGLAEIRSLSGGLALTEAGLSRVQAGGSAEGGSPDLSDLLPRLETALDSLGLEAKARRDLEADLATLRAQMGRSESLAVVVEATLRAVKQTLESASADKQLLKTLAGLVEAF
ncbi:MAG: hypothetical protein SV487_03275 [Thermodesulfobacteriota bacterium]|nr:hypothetical protein [Thermodesulfobacteriota bacterium]